MIKIVNMDESDINIFNFILDYHAEVVGEYSGRFFKYMEDNKTRYLYRKDDLFVIYSLEEDGYLYYQIFFVDENYKIIQYDGEDYVVDLTNDVYTFIHKETNVSSVVKILKRPNGEDNDGYNGAITYAQYAPSSDTNSVILYQYMCSDARNKDRIFDFHMKEPLELVIGKGVDMKKHQRYVLRTADRSDMFYDLMLKKEHLTTYDSVIKRYYKMLFMFNGYGATGFPFCKQYKVEDIKKMLGDLGHDLYIPEEIRNLYNYLDEDLKVYQELANVVKEVEKEIDKNNVGPVLSFKNGENNE